MTEVSTRLLLRLINLHERLSKTADEEDARAALGGRDGKRTVWTRLSELQQEIDWVRAQTVSTPSYARQVGPGSTLP